MVAEVITTALVGLGGALIRNLTGWLKNAVADGKFDKYELSQLAVTSIEVVLMTVCINLGFNIDAVSAAAIATSIQILLPVFKKK